MLRQRQLPSHGNSTEVVASVLAGLALLGVFNVVGGVSSIALQIVNIIILSLLVFGYFLGFVGLMIAVPVTALLLVVLEQREAGRGTGV